jgi:hypothetical protein
MSLSEDVVSLPNLNEDCSAKGLAARYVTSDKKGPAVSRRALLSHVIFCYELIVRLAIQKSNTGSVPGHVPTSASPLSKSRRNCLKAKRGLDRAVLPTRRMVRFAATLR